MKNTKGIDILVCNEEATKNLGIQVKTNQINKSEWVLNEKCEKLNDENIEITAVLKNPTIENNKLIECNSSLKEQLLISQNQNSELLHNLDQARNRIKILKNTLIKNDI